MEEITRKLQDNVMTRPLYVAISFLAGVALVVVRGEEESQRAYLTRAGEILDRRSKKAGNCIRMDPWAK